jgi:hypothetical protein
MTPNRLLLPPYINFFHNFDHSSYSKNYASIIYFAYYILYYCWYFKLDLTFYIFAIIFGIRRMVKVGRKNQQRQVFRYGGSMKYMHDESSDMSLV